VSLSEDGGKTFRLLGEVPATLSLGRAQTAFLGDKSFVVTWLDKRTTGGQWRASRFRQDGVANHPLTLARVPPSRASGFPALAQLPGDELGAVFAYTSVDGGERFVACLRLEPGNAER
jgi:hypothetical protein